MLTKNLLNIQVDSIFNKKVCSHTKNKKSKITALCSETIFCVFLKNDFLFLDKKMDIYFCPFFLSDAISFFEKMIIFSSLLYPRKYAWINSLLPYYPAVPVPYRRLPAYFSSF